MITKERQLEIAKEALETCERMAGHNNDGISYDAAVKGLKALEKVEAEVIARMVPIYQAMFDQTGLWMEIEKADAMSASDVVQTLYRLPDSKTEEEL